MTGTVHRRTFITVPETDVPPLGITVRVRTVAMVIAIITAALPFAHLAVHLLAQLGVLTYEGRLVGAFDMDAETSIPTWYNMMLLMAIALLLATTSLATARGRERRIWMILAIVFAYLSLDEGAALHESLMYTTRNLLGITGGPLWYAWVIPVGIALLVAAPFLVRFVVRLPVLTRRLVIVAGALYVGGALGVEVISASAGAEVESFLRDEFDPLVWILAGFEETLEIAGLAVMAIAMLLHLRDHALAGRRLGIVLR
ncbi:MAG: hypothetical protein DI573_12340 [Microbacterium sp.]|uniref:hypothetical protein n=1 Tax=unclassified Microbacterium TaxID=2609290 RepID=UPI000DB610DD|nr:hypothetical protein [Microbacterium sp.]PZU37068.1 MAG: hypothetical protein DI573_12340 [Microbacterium sp.]